MSYRYAVRKIERVLDGDTFDVRFWLGPVEHPHTLGFGITAPDMCLRVRLADFDAPELYGSQTSAAGHEAKAFAEAWLWDRHDRLTLHTYKGAQSTVGLGDGAFGRWKGALVDNEGQSLAAALTAAGFAETVTSTDDI